MSASTSTASEAKTKALKATFQRFDADGSGLIDKEELQSALKVAGYSFKDEVIASLYKLVSKSPEGLDFDAFVDLTHFMGFMRETFSSIDVDGNYFAFLTLLGNGTLDKTELSQALLEIGYEFTDPKVISTLIAAVDDDENGVIDFEEFVDLSFYLRHLRSLFIATDADGSGEIDSDELETLLKRSGLAHSPDVVSKVLADLGNDGGLGFEGFVVLVFIIEYGDE